jgi:cytochrome b6-f complex iron-sulfur subunit
MNNHLSRREFLRALTVVGASAMGLTAAVGEAEASAPREVPVGRVGEFASGEYRAITLPGGEVVDVRRRPGSPHEFEALSAKCTHKGCTVAWVAKDKQFVCPCHHGRYSADGKNIAGPPPAPLQKLPIRVVHGVVLVGAPSRRAV